jgi:hypothetical protein
VSPNKKSLTIAAAWIVLGAVLAVSALLVDLSLNLFDWHGEWTGALVVACLVFGSALAATLFLHQDTCGAGPMLVAVLVTVSLTALGAAHLPAEPTSPGSFLGRSRASPFGYRLALAFFLALPAILLAIRRWRTDASDSWLRRRAPRLVPPVATLALALIVGGIAGRRASDPAPYEHALEVLGGPSNLVAFAELAVATGKALGQAQSLGELLVPELVEQRVRQHMRTPPGTREAEHHDRLERFLGSAEVPETIRAGVRAACTSEAATHPLRAHGCARDVLIRARQRAEHRRNRFGMLAGAGVPIAAAAIALLWRARRPRPESVA